MNASSPAALSHAYRFLPGEPSPSGGPPLTLLLLHGTGGDEDSLLELGRSLRPTANLLSPRGQVLENGLPRFFRRLAEGVFDVPDLIARTHALADFVSAAAASYAFDPARVVAVGYSNGANVAASTLLLRPGTLAGAALWRPMLPLRPETPPALAGVPVLLASGRHDGTVPAGNVEGLAALLREAGASVTHHWSDAGHPLASPDLAATVRWLEASFPAQAS